MSKYKQYDETTKRTIVELYEKGKSATDLAREYGLSVKNIYNWKKLYGTIKAEDGTLTNNKEIIELKKENSKLQQEVEILKKAMVIFTKK
ncbi:MAG: transposase [bacterium]|nr:transposase [bacterium]